MNNACVALLILVLLSLVLLSLVPLSLVLLFIKLNAGEAVHIEYVFAQQGRKGCLVSCKPLVSGTTVSAILFAAPGPAQLCSKTCHLMWLCVIDTQ